MATCISSSTDTAPASSCCIGSLEWRDMVLMVEGIIEQYHLPFYRIIKQYGECGADRAAIVYSLVACCKAAEIDPREWMEDVLRQIPYYQRDGRDLEELLPLTWKDSHVR